jgi:hypothetical protein
MQVGVFDLKIGVIVLLFLMSLGSCALPFMVSKYVKNTVVLFSIMNCLSGGVVLGISSFSHIIIAYSHWRFLFTNQIIILIKIFKKIMRVLYLPDTFGLIKLIINAIGAALSHMIPSATQNFIDYFANKENSPFKEYPILKYFYVFNLLLL